MNEALGSFSRAIEQKEVMRLIGVGVGHRLEWSDHQCSRGDRK